MRTVNANTELNKVSDACLKWNLAWLGSERDEVYFTA